MQSMCTSWICIFLIAVNAGGCGDSKDGSSGASSETTVDPTSGSTGGGAGSGATADPTSGTTGTGEMPGDPAIEMQCHDSSSANQIDGLCQCFVAAGAYPDQQSCLTALTPPAAFIDCLCSIYAKYPELSAYFDCTTPVSAAYGACVASAACDQTKLDACGEAADMASIECGQPPQGALNEAGMKCTLP